MAEIELSILQWQCLEPTSACRRIPDYAAMRMVDVDGRRLATSGNDQKK